MRYSSVLALAAATAPLAVSAKGTLGFCLGVRKPGRCLTSQLEGRREPYLNGFTDASCKTQQDFASDFAKLSSTSKIVRTYSAVDQAVQPACHVPSAILPAAKAAGVKVLLGLWFVSPPLFCKRWLKSDFLGFRVDTPEAYQADHDEILNTLKEHPEWSDAVYGFTVGSETLYRHEQDASKGLSADALLKTITGFKSDAVKAGLNQPVGTADSWNKFQDGTANEIIPAVDILYVASS